MLRFAILRESIHGRPVAVNPAHVIRVDQLPDEPNRVAVLTLVGGSNLGVRGSLSEVVQLLCHSQDNSQPISDLASTGEQQHRFEMPGEGERF